MIEVRLVMRRTHFEVRGIEKILQQRTKTKWIDGSTDKNGYYDWSEWGDVPVIKESDL